MNRREKKEKNERKTCTKIMRRRKGRRKRYLRKRASVE